MTNRPLAVVVVMAVALATVGPGAVGAVASASTADRPATPPDNGTGNASMGASISGFMQASAADAESEVDNEVFRARMNGASNETRRALVAERTETHQARLERLREQRRAILTGDGNLTVADRAKAARLTAEINSLRRAVDTTDELAMAAGIEEPGLDRLDRNVSKLDGSEVSDIAGDIADPPGREGDRAPPSPTETEGEREPPSEAPGEGAGEDKRDRPNRNVTDAPGEGNGNNPDGEGPSGDTDDGGPPGEGSGDSPGGEGPAGDTDDEESDDSDS